MNKQNTSNKSYKAHASAIMRESDANDEKCQKLETALQKAESELQTLKTEFEKRLEEQVCQKTLELQLFHDLSQKSGHTLNYDDLFHSMLEHLHLVVPCDVAGCILIEGQKCNLFLKAYRPISLAVQMLIQQKLLEGLMRISNYVMQNCSLCVHYLNPTVVELAHVSIIDLGSYLLVPLITNPEQDKQIIGLLFIGAEKEQQFTENHICLLSTIATHASIMVQQLRVLLAAEQSRLENEKSRQALEKERELNELKSRVIRTISHEYRTPITIISLAAELLEKQYDRLTERQRLNCLKKIGTSTRQMTSLIDDVLLLNQAEDGKLQLHPIAIDLVQFCHQLVDDFQLLADKGQQVQLTYQDLPDKVYLDEKLLWQILSNLLSNAIKYSHESGIINFKIFFQQPEISFIIQDRGIGIPPEDLPRLFDFYHRADNVKNFSGTGLGLAIVKKCLDLHGGRIEVRSILGIGTTFIVKLPAKFT